MKSLLTPFYNQGWGLCFFVDDKGALSIDLAKSEANINFAKNITSVRLERESAESLVREVCLIYTCRAVIGSLIEKSGSSLRQSSELALVKVEAELSASECLGLEILEHLGVDSPGTLAISIGSLERCVSITVSKMIALLEGLSREEISKLALADINLLISAMALVDDLLDGKAPAKCADTLSDYLGLAS